MSGQESNTPPLILDDPPTASRLISDSDLLVSTPKQDGDEESTIIAGYHWFTDWGRDTMIGLEGLTL